MSNKIDYKGFGRRVKEVRERLNLTEAQLARKCNLPVNTIGVVEKTIIEVPSNILLKIANGLGASLDYLIHGTITKSNLPDNWRTHAKKEQQMKIFSYSIRAKLGFNKFELSISATSPKQALEEAIKLTANIGEAFFYRKAMNAEKLPINLKLKGVYDTGLEKEQ